MTLEQFADRFEALKRVGVPVEFFAARAKKSFAVVDAVALSYGRRLEALRLGSTSGSNLSESRGSEHA